MSTAIAEPEVKQPEIKTEGDPAQIVAGILNPTVLKEGAPVAKPEPKKEAKKEEGKKEEAKKEETPTESFAALRKKYDEAEATAKTKDEELRKVREEFEAHRKNPVPKEFEEKLTAAEKRALELDSALRAADLARHPDFKRKYDTGIKTALEKMAQAAQAAGLEPAAINSALNRWDKATFGEWIGNMDAGTRLQFESAFHRAEELDSQRAIELQEAEKTWEDMQKQRSADMERQDRQRMDSLTADKRAALEELEKANELFRGDEALRKETEALLDKAAGLNGERLTNRQILSNLAGAHVLARHFVKKTEELEGARKEIEDLKKKLEERDAFIKNANGSFPGITGSGVVNDGKVDDNFIAGLLRPKVRT